MLPAPSNSTPAAEAAPVEGARWAGDPDLAALERAVAESARTLHSIAAAVLGRRNDAEDVVQEAVIVALGKRDELGRVENLTAWLGQIVRFVALNRRRSARLRMAQGEEAYQHVASTAGHGRHPPSGPTADEPTATAAARGGSVVDSAGRLVGGDFAFDDRVLRALDGLDETPRACLLLRVINELSYKEIGRALDIPEGTAMSHVFRARRYMMERLSDAKV